jgi:hypothetical protein
MSLILDVFAHKEVTIDKECATFAMPSSVLPFASVSTTVLVVHASMAVGLLFDEKTSVPSPVAVRIGYHVILYSFDLHTYSSFNFYFQFGKKVSLSIRHCGSV